MGRISILAQGKVLFHKCHTGIVRIKAVSQFFWWPNLTKDLEILVESCNLCQSNSPTPEVKISSQWPAASLPWSCLHINFAGTLHGKYYLLLVDKFNDFSCCY